MHRGDRTRAQREKVDPPLPDKAKLRRVGKKLTDERDVNG